MEEKSFYKMIENIKMPIRIVILVGTIVLIAGLFTYFGYIPKTKEIAKTDLEITNLEKELRRAEIQRRKLPEKKAEMERVDAEFKEALKLLPNDKEIPKLLRKVTELGNDSQLDFRVFHPKNEKPHEFYVEIPVSIEVRGTYHNVAIFFDKVRKMERILNIHNVSMRPTMDRSTTLITTCDAVTYRFKGTSE